MDGTKSGFIFRAVLIKMIKVVEGGFDGEWMLTVRDNWESVCLKSEIPRCEYELKRSNYYLVE